MEPSSIAGDESVSVVIPVYNAEATLGELVPDVIAVLRERERSFEIILVNDGSRDGSWQAICALAGEYPEVRGIDLMRNFGQHNAVLAGVTLSRNALVLTMDDDLQHPPAEIPRLLSALGEDYDVVYGTPEAEPHGLWRALASRLTKLALQRAMGVETASKISAFRVFRGNLRGAFERSLGPFVSVDVLLAWATNRFTSVRVRHEPRRRGQSNYSFTRLLMYAVNLITGFTIWPLRVAAIVGFGFALLGLVALVFVLIRFAIEGSVVPGFPFLASLVSVFAGAQLFSLGVLGEYLARVHVRSMGKPPYLVRGETGDPGGSAP